MAVSVASSPGAIAGRFVVGSSDDIVGWLWWRLVGLKFSLLPMPRRAERKQVIGN